MIAVGTRFGSSVGTSLGSWVQAGSIFAEEKSLELIFELKEFPGPIFEDVDCNYHKQSRTQNYYFISLLRPFGM